MKAYQLHEENKRLRAWLASLAEAGIGNDPEEDGGMARLPRIRLIARWVLAAALLAAGVYLLVSLWYTFSRFGLTRGLGYPTVSHAEITFWHAFPGFQAGLLLGLLLGLVGGSVGRLLLVLNLATWAALAVKLSIIFWLFSRGVMF